MCLLGVQFLGMPYRRLILINAIQAEPKARNNYCTRRKIHGKCNGKQGKSMRCARAGEKSFKMVAVVIWRLCTAKSVEERFGYCSTSLFRFDGSGMCKAAKKKQQNNKQTHSSNARIDSTQKPSHKWKHQQQFGSFGTATLKWSFMLLYFSQAFSFHAPKKTTNSTLARSTIRHTLYTVLETSSSHSEAFASTRRVCSHSRTTFQHRTTITFVPVLKDLCANFTELDLSAWTHEMCGV